MSKMFNLETFAEGAYSEQFNSEMQKVLENITDPNTEATKKRKIVMTVILEPNSKREVSNVTIEPKATLAPVKAYETSILIEKDMNTGEIDVDELVNEEDKNTSGNSAEVIDLRKQAK